MNSPTYKDTPIEQLKSPLFDSMEVKFLVKREDLNHPCVSGNKWWKLKYNLKEAQRQSKTLLLTFGGAFSNHIYSTAAAANELGLKSIGVIRGERTQPLNATLNFAKERGMQLHFVSREEYRSKSEADFIEMLKERFGDFYLIPEGGTNALAIKGCEEWALQLRQETEFNYLCLPVGTGGTLTGLINGLKAKSQVIGFSSLKGGDFLKDQVGRFVTSETRWQIELAYHFGGYGKMNETLLKFMRSFEKQFNIPLDPVYTAKAMFGVFDLIEKGFFKKGSIVLFLHTGGLQGRHGINFE